MKVYLAGPIMHTHDNGRSWREGVKATFPDVTFLDPLDHEHEFNGYGEAAPEFVVEKDREMIRECDAVFLKYQKTPTWGSPREQEYAKHLGKPVGVYTNEEDCSPWVTVDAEVVSDNIMDVMAALRSSQTFYR